MRRQRGILWSALSGLVLGVACGEPAAGPEDRLAPSFSAGGVGRPSVLVNPNAGGNGTATTIQEGIDMVAEGGKVRVLPGTYSEAIVIDKGLTLEPVGGSSGAVIVTAPGTPLATIEVATPNPVTIRDLTVLKPGVNGVLGNGIVDVTLERLTMVAVGLGPGTNRFVRMVNNGTQTGGRARLVVRENVLDGREWGSLGGFASISLQADIDAVIERNVVRRGMVCIFVESFSPVGIHADIVNNDLDECDGRTAIDVGPTPTQVASFGTVGVVNIVGNTIRNSRASCVATTAIHYQLYTGRIERNSIIGFLQACAAPITDALPAAIWVGSLRGFPPASPVVRYNDIHGNAHAGLRVAPNITTSLDARCNYWGSASGPSGAGSGTGDAVIVEAGGARPVLLPVATEPVAQNDSCHLQFSLWSTPVNLGPVINTTANEFTASLSSNGLSLFFSSGRPGPAGTGGQDIWVTQRGCLECPWQPAVSLGPVVNSSAVDDGPSLSPDGHLLFFHSNRDGGQGNRDLWVSRRADTQNDLGWESPVNLGPNVNTALDEQGPEFIPSTGELFFQRGTMGTALVDIFVAPVTADAHPLGPAVLVADVSSPVNDGHPALRIDGGEIIVASGREGTLGNLDLWVAYRSEAGSAWSMLENLGAPVNGTVADQTPSLSFDGRTLFFAGGAARSVFGGNDIWMSTRTGIGPGDGAKR